jgi:DNA end-binding protein Ku
MAPHTVWSGNLRLSLVLIPVRLCSATSAEAGISFRQIHAPSGQPIRQVKGVRDGDFFTEVPEDEIVKGYEHAKGHHVLIAPEELDGLKLEAKHTIDMVRFVDAAEIDDRYWEKPYYLMPDGDSADEGYAVIRQALAETDKVAIGQLIMTGRAHLVGIKPLGKGLMLSILRYAHQVRPAEPYFDSIAAEPKPEAVKLAVQLIEAQAGPFVPETMPNQFARAVRELVEAKIEQRTPEVDVTPAGKPIPSVIDIMAVLKQSVESKAKPRAVVRKLAAKSGLGKAATPPSQSRSRRGQRRSAQ